MSRAENPRSGLVGSDLTLAPHYGKPKRVHPRLFTIPERGFFLLLTPRKSTPKGVR